MTLRGAGMSKPLPHPRPRPRCPPPTPQEEHPGGDQQERELPSSALHCTTHSGTQCTPGPAEAVIWPGKQEHPAPSLTPVSSRGGGQNAPSFRPSFTPVLQLATSPGCWRRLRAQPILDTLHPAHSSSLHLLQRVVLNNDSKLPATPCSFFLS